MRTDDVIQGDERQGKAVASYFKEVRVKEPQSWKGNMTSHDNDLKRESFVKSIFK